MNNIVGWVSSAVLCVEKLGDIGQVTDYKGSTLKTVGLKGETDYACVLSEWGSHHMYLEDLS